MRLIDLFNHLGIGIGQDGDSQSSTTKGGIYTSNVIITDKAEQEQLAKAQGQTLEQNISNAKIDISTDDFSQQGAKANGALNNNFNKDAVQKELDVQTDVMQKFSENSKTFNQQQNEKAEQARLAGEIVLAKEIEEQTKVVNIGLGLLTLDNAVSAPTSFKVVQGLDTLKTGYESFKDSLNNSDNLKLNLDNLVNTPLAQYAQTEMGKYAYCQKQPNAKACMDSINHSNVDPKIQHMSNIVSSYVDRAKNTTISAVTNHDFNTESEIGGTAIVGLGFRQSTGVAIDSNGNKCTTFTTCGLAGPMVSGFSHVGGSVSTGSLSEGRVWQLGYIANVTSGLGIGKGGTINSDGSFTGGFEWSMGVVLAEQLWFVLKK